MPELTANLLEVFRALDEAGIRYVVVGGVAVVLHGHVRMTVDLDLVLDLESDRVAAAMERLSALGFVPRVPVPAAQFADAAARESWITEKNMQVFSLVDPANPLRVVDLFVREPLAFDSLWADSERVTLGDLEVPVASIDHLIQMKQEAGRRKDLDDIDALNAIREGDGPV